MKRSSIAGIVLAAALVGCGAGGASGDGDTSSAQSAARAYVEASNQRDFDRLCNVLSEDYKVELHMGSRCTAYLQEQTSGDVRQSLTLTGVEEDGDQAVASVSGTVKSGSGTGRGRLLLELKQVGGGWHVTHLGGRVNY